MAELKDIDINRDDRRNGEYGRVKDHPTWSNEAKPWATSPWPFNGKHTSIELHYLYRTVLNLGKGNYANLGVFKGASTNAFVCGAVEHGGHVYGVDLFEPTEMYPDLLDKSESEVEEAFKAKGTDTFVTLCKGLTSEWAKKLSHLKFKFIFIDADHRYEAVLEDFKLWSPLLEKGGLISFHDCNMETVHQVITEELDDWDLVDHAHRIKSFKREGE